MSESGSASRALILSPHPDDESIGCGGTLRKHVLDGDVVHAIFLTSGERGGHGVPLETTARMREQEARDAAMVLGLEGIEFWREPDGALQVTPRLVRRLVNTLRELQPHILYAPHEGEDHPDHKSAALLATSAVQTLLTEAADFPAPLIRMFEVWTPIQHIDQIVDITEFLETKLAAIRAHVSQCRVMRFDEASKGLARYRGEMHCWPGGAYAEAFAEWRPTRSKSDKESVKLEPAAAGGNL
ncbi:MAG: glucosamine-6-phosphate deaminase-like protein [Phycisphaerales bacterium]|nr:glucosamine-6-phosphate deaminase-like protein [Phycisphaerales bacterium]